MARDKIDIMKDEKIVMTLYGKGETAEYVTFQTFKSPRTAHLYIDAVTADNDGGWVRCEFIDGRKKYQIQRADMTGEIFKAEMLKLNNRSIQALLEEIGDPWDIARALRGDDGEDGEVGKKILENMSKKAATSLKEDMDYLGPVRKSDCSRSQEKILDMLDMLEELVEDGDIPDDPDIEFPREG
jgi:hypothetical protein